MKYLYLCQSCGEIESAVSADVIQCRCGKTAKRVRAFSVNAASLKSQDRWDPVVGAYVRNDREFRTLLAQGQAREAAELGMDVNLVTLDARDTEGLAELHGHAPDAHAEAAEQTARSKHDAQAVS